MWSSQFHGVTGYSQQRYDLFCNGTVLQNNIEAKRICKLRSKIEKKMLN